jgi:heme oxygenase (biliverdin-IX-beta and delta-forming)
LIGSSNPLDAPVPASTLFQRLKAETAAQHSSLELRLNLLRPGFTPADYVDLLERFYGYYQPWEAEVLATVRASLPALAAGRNKVPLLQADLRHFRRDPLVIASCPNLPRPQSLPQALGSMYVIEGSTLGGQWLTRHFRDTLGLQSEGLAFFNGYGARTGAMWKSFREQAAAVVSPSDEDEAVLSATDTFDSLAAWLVGEQPA